MKTTTRHCSGDNEKRHDTLIINGWTLGRFTDYLENTIIPDSKLSGFEEYAEDLETALQFIQQLKK